MVAATQLTTAPSVVITRTTQHACAKAINPRTSYEPFENFQLPTNRIKSENGEHNPMPRYSTVGSVTPHAHPVQMFRSAGSSVWVQLLHPCIIPDTSVCSVPQVKDLQPTVRYNCFQAHLPIVRTSFTFCRSQGKSNRKSSLGKISRK